MANRWEKFSIYMAAIIGILTFIFYIADMKERIARIETNHNIIERIAKLEGRIGE